MVAVAVRRSGPIRYARAGRFEPPRPVPAGTDDVASVSVCPQPPSRLDAVMGPPHDTPIQDEDCLKLTVVGPAGTERARPVMVFFHGGAFSSGGGLFAWYDGARLAADGDVVVVSVNYRLGLFGFLVLDGVSDGNLGILDQLAALRWVRENIARHGGDPDNVTVFGQSAGAISIAIMIEHRLDLGLFRRAIIQSAPLNTPLVARDEALRIGARFTELLGQDPRAAQPHELVAAHRATTEARAREIGMAARVPFEPTAGVTPLDALTAAKADEAGLEVLLGWTLDELTAFQPEPDLAMAAPPTRMAFAAAGRDFWARRVKNGASVQAYRIDWRPAGSPYGATHCVELPLLLGDESAWRGSPMIGDVPWSRVDEMGMELRAIWSRFAGTGRVDHQSETRIPMRWAHDRDQIEELATNDASA